jgi:histidinol-phosphate aminotransferase
LIPGRDVTSFLDRLPETAFPVIDEAYAEFVTNPGFCDGIGLFRSGRRLAAIRTFSKIYGLAGLRVGYAVLPKELSASADNIRNSFNVNRLAQIAALAALQDDQHVARTKAATVAGRNQLREGLQKLGLKPIPSETNFVCVDVGQDAEDLHRRLLSRGLIIRPLTAFAMPTYIRITVGSPEENQEILQVLGELLEKTLC